MVDVKHSLPFSKMNIVLKVWNLTLKGRHFETDGKGKKTNLLT